MHSFVSDEVLGFPYTGKKINQEGTKVNTSKYKNYDELPLFPNAAMAADVLGISPSSG